MKKFPLWWRGWVSRRPFLKKAFKVSERKWRGRFPPQILSGYVILLSYPRSGNHWVRYIIESITGYTTIGARDGLGPGDTSLWIDTPLRTKLDIPHTRPSIIAIKRHKLRKFDSPEAPLLLLVRKPSSALLSHNPGFLSNTEELSGATNDFIEMCRTADHRLSSVSLVFFEDFVHSDVNIVKNAIHHLMSEMKILGFDDATTAFISDISIHTQRSLLTLERPPQAQELHGDSLETDAARQFVDSIIVEAAHNSATLRKIVARYSLVSTNC